MPPTSCCLGQAGLSPSARQPLLCLRLWTQLGECLCPREERGFVTCWKVPAYLAAKTAGLFFWDRPQTQTHTALLEGTEEGREGAAPAQGEVLAAASAPTIMKIELNPAYLKSEGKGWGSGRPIYLFSPRSPLLFLGVLHVKSNKDSWAMVWLLSCWMPMGKLSY